MCVAVSGNEGRDVDRVAYRIVTRTEKGKLDLVVTSEVVW